MVTGLGHLARSTHLRTNNVRTVPELFQCYCHKRPLLIQLHQTVVIPAQCIVVLSYEDAWFSWCTHLHCCHAKFIQHSFLAHSRVLHHHHASSRLLSLLSLLMLLHHCSLSHLLHVHFRYSNDGVTSTSHDLTLHQVQSSIIEPP